MINFLDHKSALSKTKKSNHLNYGLFKFIFLKYSRVILSARRMGSGMRHLSMHKPATHLAVDRPIRSPTEI